MLSRYIFVLAPPDPAMHISSAPPAPQAPTAGGAAAPPAPLVPTAMLLHVPTDKREAMCTCVQDKCSPYKACVVL